MSRNIRKYYILRFFSGFIFTYTIQAIYLLSRGITATQLALFSSLTIIISTLTEIPTGYVADKFGRKYSVALSYFLNSLIFITLIFVHDISLLVFIALLKGISDSLESGAYESLIYEEVKSNRSKDTFLKVTTRGTNVAIGIGILATFLGPILYAINTSIPFILSAIVYIIMTGLIVSFEEKTISHQVEDNLRIIDGIKTITTIRPILIITLVDLLLLIFVNIYYQVAFFPKIENLGLNVKYFGVIDVITLAITSLFLFLIPKISWKSDKFTIISFSLLVGLLFVLFGLSHTLSLVLIFGIFFDIAWNLRRHIIPTVTNKYFDSRSRATSLSSMSFVSNLGAALLVPIVTVLFTKSYFYSLVPLLFIAIILCYYPRKPEKF